MFTGGKPTGGEFVINMNSIVDEDLTDASWNEKLIGHLKSDDFFSVEKFPASKLALTSVVAKGGNKYLFKGNLTIKGITHPAEFEATVVINNNSASPKEHGNRPHIVQYPLRIQENFSENLGDKAIYDEFTLDFKVVASK